jgi:hypothetical protein
MKKVKFYRNLVMHLMLFTSYRMELLKSTQALNNTISLLKDCTEVQSLTTDSSLWKIKPKSF